LPSDTDRIYENCEVTRELTEKKIFPRQGKIFEGRRKVSRVTKQQQIGLGIKKIF
jgi:cytoskeletal protein CcmA (bactofilin family)